MTAATPPPTPSKTPYKPGAIIAFDDYLWNDPYHNQQGIPKLAIGALSTLYARKLEILESSYQVWLRKLAD